MYICKRTTDPGVRAEPMTAAAAARIAAARYSDSELPGEGGWLRRPDRRSIVRNLLQLCYKV